MAGVVSAVAGVIQYKLGNYLSDQKDRYLAKHQADAEITISAADVIAQHVARRRSFAAFNPGGTHPPAGA
jgi:hypothetical protein